jgi:hypothetical protein
VVPKFDIESEDFDTGLPGEMTLLDLFDNGCGAML